MKTKYDLSANSVTLDYAELLRTAHIATMLAKEELHRSLDRWYDYTAKEPVSPTYAEHMRQTAEQLAQASITLYNLYHGQFREDLSVENHIVKEEQSNVQ